MCLLGRGQGAVFLSVCVCVCVQCFLPDRVCKVCCLVSKCQSHRAGISVCVLGRGVCVLPRSELSGHRAGT